MPLAHPANWFDRISFPIAPRWTNKRIAARIKAELIIRNFEGASVGRRTQGWRKSSGDANAVNFGGLTRLRENAQDLVRNNPYAESAVATVADHTVGYGIVAKPAKGTPTLAAARFTPAWKAWAETTACDADGRHDLAGLQKLVMRNVPVAGEVLVRRRWRRPEDGLPIPVQLQVLEADYLDTLKDGITTPSGGSIVQGIEYDAIGRRRAYWLFREHPGSNLAGLRTGFGQSVPVPASEILHVFKAGRPGQSRGASWFAPIMLRLKDFDEYEDAQLMKQKIAACLAVLTSDVEGSTPALGATTTDQPTWDYLEPGMIANLPPGRSVSVVQPPNVTEYDAYAKNVLRAIATGFGVTFEDLTGCYDNLPFSAARMSRLRHWARVDDWRWRMLIPQFCDPVWAWAVEAAQVAAIIRDTIKAEWTAPPMPMIEPDKEGLAYQRNIRTGIQTLSEAIRERGYDPGQLLAEYADDNTALDRLGIILDSDARNTTQQGGPRQTAASQAAAPSAVPAAASNGNGRSNGHHTSDFDAEQAWRSVERTLGLIEARQRMPADAPTINVPVTISEGAMQTHVAAAEAPQVTVDARTSIADGAVRVDVAPPPPAEITVEGPEIHVGAPNVTIEEGAVQVQAPTTPLTTGRRKRKAATE